MVKSVTQGGRGVKISGILRYVTFERPLDSMWICKSLKIQYCGSEILGLVNLENRTYLEEPLLRNKEANVFHLRINCTY